MIRDARSQLGCGASPGEGFRAELDGFDLATLMQMVCARRLQQVIEVRGAPGQGYLYFAEGRVVHAVSPGLVGEDALVDMLSWPSGGVSVVERPFPVRGSLEGTIEGLLLRAAQQRDELAELEEARESSSVQKKPVHEGRRLELVGDADSDAPNKAHADAPVLASVRLSTAGEVLSSNGKAEQLAELVAYVTRIGELIGTELALDPFESLYAELGDERLLVFSDGDDVVGLLLTPGTTAEELRRQLGM